jgi:glycine/D-amino acid oxidase-like deaminating enzyme
MVSPRLPSKAQQANVLCVAGCSAIHLLTQAGGNVNRSIEIEEGPPATANALASARGRSAPAHATPAGPAPRRRLASLTALPFQQEALDPPQEGMDNGQNNEYPRPVSHCKTSHCEAHCLGSLLAFYETT